MWVDIHNTLKTYNFSQETLWHQIIVWTLGANPSCVSFWSWDGSEKMSRKFNNAKIVNFRHWIKIKKNWILKKKSGVCCVWVQFLRDEMNGKVDRIVKSNE